VRARPRARPADSFESILRGDSVRSCTPEQTDARVGVLQEFLATDPLNTDILAALGDAYFSRNLFQEARETYSRLLRANPSYVGGYARMAQALLFSLRYDEALEAARKEVDQSSREQMIALVTWSMGRQDDGNVLFLKYEKTYASVDPFSIAENYAWQGKNDQAFQWLDRALKVHNPGMASIRLDQFLVPLRGDARYVALIKRMNLDRERLDPNS
jgi:tetratricopeptide (TPR) repeat protein